MLKGQQRPGGKSKLIPEGGEPRMRDGRFSLWTMETRWRILKRGETCPDISF